MVEDIEKRILRSRLTCQLLNVVDEQHVDHLIKMDEIGDFALFISGLELRLEFVHRDIEHAQFGMTLPNFVSDGLHDVGFAQSRIAPDIERVERRVARIDGDGHAGGTGQPVAFALDEGIERQIRIELRIDDDFLDPRDDERIFDVFRVGLRVEMRDRGHVRLCGGRRRVRRRHGGALHGVVQLGLLAVELRDDRTQERDVVLLDLVVIALVGDAQTQRRPVESQRNDRLEPFLELLRRNAGFDRIEAVLPDVIVCLRIGQHGTDFT